MSPRAQANSPPPTIFLTSKVARLPIAALSPHPKNPRTHSKKQIKKLVKSLKKYGFINPIIIDSAGDIIAGEGRYEAAKLLGMSEVPTICLDHLSEAERHAFMIADNRLAELAGWDMEILAEDLKIISTLDVSFDLTATGFDTPQIDLLINKDAADETTIDEDWGSEAIREPRVVTQSGDIWHMGHNRLVCGDALSPSTYVNLLGAEKAEMIITDPPYNVPIDGHVSGLGAQKHRNFFMAAGEMSRDEFTEFLRQGFELLCTHSTDGSIHFIFMDWRHLSEILAAGDAEYAELKNLCVWKKDNAGMGSFYRSQHELAFVYKNGTNPHINNFELGQHGRYRTNVWEYAGMNGAGEDRLNKLAVHPTVKPPELFADAILDCSRRGGIILDPFTGSGSTFIAAEHTGRRAYGIEIDPGYVDLAVRRWERFTGNTAIHAETGVSFSELDRVRANAEGDQIR